MPRRKIISAIDVGTTKIATIMADVKAENDIEILGVGVVPSHGLHKGIVVNMDEAKASVLSSAREAQRISGIRIDSAYIGVTGRHISCLNNQGVVSIPRTDRLVRPEDLKRALSVARNIFVPEGNSSPYLAAVSNDARAALILIPSNSTPTTETVISALITRPLSSILSMTSARVPAVSFCACNTMIHHPPFASVTVLTGSYLESSLYKV